MTYDELEPYYDRFEKLCGTSGKAGNLRGQKIEGGNVFEGPRSNEYPNKPLMMTQAGADVREGGARSSAITRSRTPVSQSSARLHQYRRHDARRSASIAATAKASAARPMLRRARRSASCRCCCSDPKFELRAHAYVSRLDLRQGGEEGNAASIYIDTRTGEEIRAAGRSRRALAPIVFNNMLAAVRLPASASPTTR